MFAPIRTDRSGLDTNIYNLCMGELYMHSLLEKHHISYIFTNCVKDISNMKFTENFVYSGWCFDNINYKCFKSENEICHPIYIKKIYDIYDDRHYFIIDRDEENISDNDKIFIIKNAAIAKKNIGIRHELEHALDMYIINKNLISKELLTTALDDKIGNIKLLNTIKKYKYYFLASEQRAFLAETIYQLQRLKKNNKKKYYKIVNANEDRYMIITDLIKETYSTNNLDNINNILNYLEKDFDFQQYQSLIIFYYIYNEEKSNNIDINDVINYYKLDDEYAKDIAKNMLNILENNKDQYVKKLYDAIYNHIIFDFNSKK